MDALAYYRDSVTEQGYLADIYRPDGRDYDASYTDTGTTVRVALSDVSNSSETPVEGADDAPAYRGVVVPESDGTTPVQVNDHLRLRNTPRAYVVRTKSGIPDEIDPEIWELQLERAAADPQDEA